MKQEEFLKLYQKKGHAIQTGVMYQQAEDARTQDQTDMNKHLRVGVDTAKIDLGALIALLIRKGVIQEEDYFESVLAFMDAEIGVREAELSASMGTKITLA